MSSFQHKREQAVARILEARFTEDVAAEVVGALRPVIGIGFQPGEASLGSSKVGGRPHVPRDFRWPRPHAPEGFGQPAEMAFIAQINFSECKPFDFQDVLPSDGIMYLFGINDDCYLGDADFDGFAVCHYTGPRASLTVAEFPDGLGETEGRLVERRILFSESFVLAADDESETKRFDRRDEDLVDAIFRAAGCEAGMPPPARMLGRPYFFRDELADWFDPEKHTLVLALTGECLWRGEDDQGSIYSEGEFFVGISNKALTKGEIGEAKVVFEAGT